MTDTSSKRTGRTLDMTQGRPVKIILIFAVPLFLGILLQQLYNVVDTAIAGNILGDISLAAIGSTGQIHNMIIGFSMGMNTGFSLLISRAFGAKDQERLNLSIFWTMILNILTVAVLTSASLIFLDPLLSAMNTPAEIFGEARTYLSIILAGIPVTMAYNMSASVLRSMGNSATPLVFLVISSVLNAGLDYMFVALFHWGVAGLACATVTAQLLSAIASLVYIIIKYPHIRFKKDFIHPPKGYVKDMFLTGLSMGLMGTIVSFGGTVLQAAVNKLGRLYIAGQIGGTRIEVLFLAAVHAVCNSSATYFSQNFGAGKKQRIKQGIFASFLICAIGCAVCAAFAISPLAEAAMKLVTGSDAPEVINSGTLFIRITLLTSPWLCVLLTLRNMLQSMGHKIIPLFASVMEMGGKLLFAWALVPRFGYTAVCFCEPSLWFLCSVYVIIVCIILRKELRDDDTENIQGVGKDAERILNV